jgi:hypothetical protein
LCPIYTHQHVLPDCGDGGINGSDLRVMEMRVANRVQFRFHEPYEQRHMDITCVSHISTIRHSPQIL